jgi:hypothetical protein
MHSPAQWLGCYTGMLGRIGAKTKLIGNLNFPVLAKSKTGQLRNRRNWESSESGFHLVIQEPGIFIFSIYISLLDFLE